MSRTTKQIAEAWQICDEFGLSYADALEVVQARAKAALINQAASSGAPEGNKARQPAPLQRQRHQENEILRVIAELGHNAKALPKDTPGKPGVKAAVQGKLKFTPLIFNKAWERLSAAGDIIKPK